MGHINETCVFQISEGESSETDFAFTQSPQRDKINTHQTM